MFVQVIRGQVRDAEQVRAALDRWVEQLAAGALGWLGSTAGVSEDGRFVALVRFESEEAAQRNSNRPEQDQWWTETAKLFAGGVSFRDSSDVTVDVNGDPDKAGFVQVIEGRGSDPDRARELMAQDAEDWAAFRPDMIGSVGAGHDGGAYTVALYFTSEEAAREGERKEPPPHLKAQMDEMNALNVGEPEFLDLRQPWLYSPW
jgi:quinol monooxygenase YgiN